MVYVEYLIRILILVTLVILIWMKQVKMNSKEMTKMMFKKK